MSFWIVIKLVSLCASGLEACRITSPPLLSPGIQGGNCKGKRLLCLFCCHHTAPAWTRTSGNHEKHQTPVFVFISLYVLTVNAFTFFPHTLHERGSWVVVWSSRRTAEGLLWQLGGDLVLTEDGRRPSCNPSRVRCCVCCMCLELRDVDQLLSNCLTACCITLLLHHSNVHRHSTIFFFYLELFHLI